MALESTRNRFISTRDKEKCKFEIRHCPEEYIKIRKAQQKASKFKIELDTHGYYSFAKKCCDSEIPNLDQ